MSMISVLIPGAFIDAHVYMDFLFTQDASGRARLFRLHDIVREAARAHGMPQRQAQAAFMDNRLLETGSSSNVRDKERVVEIPQKRLRAQELPISVNGATIFDTAITYLTLFLATDEGLLSAPLDAKDPRLLASPITRLSLPCYQASPRWGGVAASCGQSGLWALINEWSLGDAKREAKQIDDAASDRNAWMGFSLVSFASRTGFKAFSALVPMGRGKRRIAAEFVDDEVSLLDLLPDDANVDLADPWTLVAAAGGALVVASRGGLLLIPTWRHDRSLDSNRIGRSIGTVSGRPLNVAETEGGYVIETDRSLVYYHAQGQQDIARLDTILMRSYPRSRRFRRVITATVDGGLLLACTLGDHPFPHSEWIPTSDSDDETRGSR